MSDRIRTAPDVPFRAAGVGLDPMQMFLCGHTGRQQGAAFRVFGKSRVPMKCAKCAKEQEMANTHATRTELLVACLKKRHHTYGQMLRENLSTSPWKRVAEFVDRHPEWMIDKKEVSVKGEKLIAWRVVRNPTYPMPV